MATPKQLPSGNWNIKVFSHFNEKGKRIYKSFTDSDKKKVIRLAHEFQDNRDEYHDQELTIAKALDEYISSKEGVLSPSTIREYRRLQEKAYDSIDALYVQRTTSKDLQYFISELSQKKSPKSVRNIYSLLSAALDMHTDKKFRVTLPQKIELEYATPDDDQVKTLLSNASDKLKLCIYLSAIGTLRRGEVCALKYKDIRRDMNAVYIHADMVQDQKGEWIYKPCPKNNSSIRHVALPEKIIDMLGEGDPEDYIIGLNPGQITHRFIYLRNKLGLSCRYHDLRHYAATIRMYMGIPLKEIQVVGGWSNPDTVNRIYINQLKSKSTGYTQQANDYFVQNLIAEE